MMHDFYFKPIGILPLPVRMPSFSFENGLCIGFMFTFILFALLIGFLLDCYAKKTWQQSSVLNIIIPVIGSSMLLFRYGVSMTGLKGLILLLILLYASNSDIKKREVTDWVHVIIVVTAFIGTELKAVPFMLFAAVCIAIPQILVAMQKESGYGGADIKMMTACAFLLGLEKGLFAIIIGLTLAVSVTFIKRKLKKQSINQSFPMVPYLALGSFVAYLT